MAVNVNGDNSLFFDAGVNDKGLERYLQQLENQLKVIAGQSDKTGFDIEKLARRAGTAFAAYASFTAGTNFVADIARVRGEFQQLEVAFSTMLGSKEKAGQLMAEVTDFAATTPFELQDVAGATRLLLAFGIEANDVTDTLRRLGDVSAGVGAPIKEIAELYGKAKVQGRLFAEDVNQLTGRGIPVIQELAKQFGVADDKVKGLVEAGKVGFPQIEQVFKNLTGEGSKFGGLMEAQSKTITGLQSNLRDAWDQMLNDIGRSQEGLFAGAITAATSLVKNYETVIDVIKVIALTYGTYRAALVATNVVEAISTRLQVQRALAGRALTTAQALQAAGTVALQNATKGLNATMLANPYVAITTAVVGFVSALVLLADNTSAQEKAQKQLNEANEQYKADVEELTNKTNELVSVINDKTKSDFAQARAFNDLKALYPEILKNTDLYAFKALSAEDAQKRFNKAVEDNGLNKLQNDVKAAEKELQRLLAVQDQIGRASGQGIGQAAADNREQIDIVNEKLRIMREELRKNEEAAWEANTPVEQQIKHYDDIRNGLLKQRSEIEGNIQKMEKMGASALDFRLTLENTNLANVNAQIDDLTAKLNSLSGGGLNPVKDKAFFDKQKKDAQEAIDQLDVNDKEFNAKKAKQIEIIRQAEAQLAKYDTRLKSHGSTVSSHTKKESSYNDLLEKRKSLLEDIEKTIASSKSVGKSDLEKQVDAINEKYQNTSKTIAEFNRKVAEFNAKNPKNQVQGVGLETIRELNKARDREISQEYLNDQKAKYADYLQQQLAIFEKFEAAKKEVGLAKAQELYRDQIGEFTDFADYISSLESDLFANFRFSLPSKQDQQKFQQIQDAYTEYSKKKGEERIEDEKARFIELLQVTATYNQQKAAINIKYDKLESDLRKNSSLSEFEERKKLLDLARADELAALDSQAARSTELYRKLNQDILTFTKERLKEEIKELKKRLKTDASLTPQQRADIQNAIDRYQGLLDQTGQLKADFKDISRKLSAVSGIFGDLAGAIRPVNEEIADILDSLSLVSSIGADAANVIASFATDPLSAIRSLVDAVIKLVNKFAEFKRDLTEQIQQVRDYNAQLIAGEEAYQALLRDRERQQARANQLRIKALEDEKRLLEQQKQAVLQSYQDIFAKLQNENFVERKRVVVGTNLFGIPRTQIREQLSSLAGKSYAELEALFTSGQLTDSAKKLFEQLRAIKDEGVDIDRLLAENAQAASELFTGTTADNIVDAIAEGFANGKRSINDFAATFEDLMRTAMISALKYQYLEEPLQEFYRQFSEAAQSDGALTSAEIAQLQSLYNSIISNAQVQFDQLQQISGLNLSSAGNSSNSLTGAIKGITEDQANLLAGQFGGLRLTALQTLEVSRRQLDALNNIQINTAGALTELRSIMDSFRAYETGIRKLHVTI